MDETSESGQTTSQEESQPKPVPDWEEEEGVSIRSRPPIFYFWPTVVAALLFMAYLGLQDQPLPRPAPVQADAQQAQEDAPADEAGEANEAGGDPLWFIPELPRRVSLVIVAIVVLLTIVYLLIHLIFSYSNTDLVDKVDGFFSRPLFLKHTLMDLVFWPLFIFVFLSPTYGLLTYLSCQVFGLMTDHHMFTHLRLLRRRLFWVIGAVLAAIAISVLRYEPEPAVQFEFAQSTVLGGVFFLLLAFNLFVFAFDFNGASLVALIAAVVGVVAIIVMTSTFYPPVGEYALELINPVTYGLELNSNFYKFYAFLLALLMEFSGLIEKSDVWTITPRSVVHYQGLLVQRSRHYGALANFHYHVEFPDLFESMLGGWAGDYILTLPREERPEVVNDVWYARYYNAKMQRMLERVGIGHAGQPG